jgi:uncharacterized membrane protein
LIQRLTARLLDPVWIYGVFGSLCGLALVFVTPPFQVPDEPSHFYRAYQVSRGDLVGQVVLGGKYAGGLLPESLSQTASHLTRDVPFHPDQKVSVSWLEDALAMDLEPEREAFLGFSNTVLYSPASYAPQAAAIALGRVFDPPPIVLFYMARIAALAFAVLLGCWTLHIAPFFRWPLLLLLLMPMTLFLSASVSADAVTNALSIAFFASILRGVADPVVPVSRARKVEWVALFVLVTLAKTGYVLLGLLVLLIPADRFGGRRRQLVFLMMFFLIGGVAFAGWSHFANSAYVPFHPDKHTNIHEQLRLVLADPTGFVGIAVRAFVYQQEAYRYMFVGVLGWLDTYLPDWLLNAYALLLLLAAAFDGHAGLRMGLVRRAWMCAIGVAGLLGISLSLYCLWSAVGSPVLDSIQGRYFIPLAPVLLLILYNGAFSDRMKAWHKAAIVLPSLVLTWAITIHRLIDRYYVQ